MPSFRVRRCCSWGTALGSTYAYVNPVVSVGLGFALFGERLTPLQFAGGAVIIAGVALMLWPARQRRKRPVVFPHTAGVDEALGIRR